MNIDPATKKGMVTGIISSIVAALFLEPLLRGSWSLVERASLSAVSVFSDSLYKSAALGQRNWVDFTVLSFFIVAVLGFSTAVVTDAWNSQRSGAVVGRQVVLKSRKLPIFMLLSLVLLISSSFLLLFMAYSDLQLNASFQQRLTIIAPLLSEEEEERFRAQWASMQKRTDYEVINRSLETRATAARVYLPPPLLQ